MIYHNFPVFPGLTYQLMTKFSIREREREAGGMAEVWEVQCIKKKERNWVTGFIGKFEYLRIKTVTY